MPEISILGVHRRSECASELASGEEPKRSTKVQVRLRQSRSPSVRFNKPEWMGASAVKESREEFQRDLVSSMVVFLSQCARVPDGARKGLVNKRQTLVSERLARAGQERMVKSTSTRVGDGKHVLEEQMNAQEDP